MNTMNCKYCDELIELETLDYDDGTAQCSFCWEVSKVPEVISKDTIIRLMYRIDELEREVSELQQEIL